MSEDDKDLSPGEALEQCIQRGYLGLAMEHRYQKPGSVIEDMSRDPKIKTALADLKEEDVQDVRVDTFLGPSEKK